MSFFFDPNVAYVLLVGGAVMAILALFAPGTGILEVGAVLILALAGYSIANLPVNVWALVLLAVSLIPFFVAVRVRKNSWMYLLGALVAMTLGSVFAFRTTESGLRLNPILAIIVSGLSAGLLWLMARKSLAAFQMTPNHSLEGLIGQIGTAKTDLRPQGAIFVGGEQWTANSEEYIPAGSAVRVVRRSGLVLDVEPVSTPESK
ncbi:MAG: hypothetical protein JW987_13760 [Anaerolineaceae bacterium]|nr:hypothetical protein [Anaerolineaceae bacterium]